MGKILLYPIVEQKNIDSRLSSIESALTSFSQYVLEEHYQTGRSQPMFSSTLEIFQELQDRDDSAQNSKDPHRILNCKEVHLCMNIALQGIAIA